MLRLLNSALWPPLSVLLGSLPYSDYPFPGSFLWYTLSSNSGLSLGRFLLVDEGTAAVTFGVTDRTMDIDKVHGIGTFSTPKIEAAPFTGLSLRNWAAAARDYLGVSRTSAFKLVHRNKASGRMTPLGASKLAWDLCTVRSLATCSRIPQIRSYADAIGVVLIHLNSYMMYQITFSCPRAWCDT